MRARGRVMKAVLLAFCLTAAACSEGDRDVTVKGSGATFPAPVYKRWFLEYFHQHREVRVNYQAIGSGAGIRQFEDGLTDFAATDAHPEGAEAVNVKGRPIFVLPMTAGSVAICYNLPGGPNEIKLSHEVYPRIFLGKITTWNDPAIQKDNPGVDLPSTPIQVVHRNDSSGTTFVFTNHLNAISDEWKARLVDDGHGGRKNTGGPGAGKSVTWPVNVDGVATLAGRGNQGVAAIIQLTPGAIGYTETSYAELAKLPIASLQNKAGNFVQPTPVNNRAALSGKNLQHFFDRMKQENKHDSYDIEITNPEGDDSYPIVTYTWMMVYRNYTSESYAKYADGRTGKALKQVLRYCLTDGQKISPELGYIALPEELCSRVLQTVGKIKAAGE